MPIFAIGLRADDVAILELLKETFGGHIIESLPLPLLYNNGKEYISKPITEWKIYSKLDLLKIVIYFDKFPLRSKKARDFKLWREAVRIYAKWGRSDSRLPVLQQAIRDGREFDAISFPKPDLGPEQLELGGIFSIPIPN